MTLTGRSSDLVGTVIEIFFCGRLAPKYWLAMYFLAADDQICHSTDLIAWRTMLLMDALA